MSRRRASGRIQKYVNQPPSFYGEPRVDLSGLAYHGPEDTPFRPLPPNDEIGWTDTRFSHTPPADDYDHPLRHGRPYGHPVHADHSYFDPTRASLHLNERNFGPMPQRPPWERPVRYEDGLLTPGMVEHFFRESSAEERHRREVEVERAVSRLPQWDRASDGFPGAMHAQVELSQAPLIGETREPGLVPPSGIEPFGGQYAPDLPDAYASPSGFETHDMFEPSVFPQQPTMEPLSPSMTPAPAFEAPLPLEQIVEQEAPRWEQPMPDPFEQMAQQFDQQMQMMDPFNSMGPMI